MENTKILEITKDIQWVGVLDKDIVTFDIVMETTYGTTYNSYFIDAQKKAVVETTKETFWEPYLEKLKTLTDPAEIKYIILNHTEPDHSGNVKNLLAIAPDATIVGSGQALNYLKEMTGIEFKSLKVKDGDTLDLGNKTLRFIGAPNLHWPDSIYTYAEEDKVLFTCDSFGAHYCNAEMYDDLCGEYDDAFNYYFDVILKPFSKFMLKAIDKIQPLDIDTICPGHGPILRTTWQEKVKRSKEMATQYLAKVNKNRANILITYVSAYGYTREMAEMIADGVRSTCECDVNILDLENKQAGEIEENLVLADALLVGSPTINQNTLLPVYKLFAVINPIRDKGKIAGSFGSYGWSGEAVKLIDSHLNNLKLNVVTEGISLKFYPNNDKAKDLVSFGKKFGEKVLESRKN